MTDNNVDLNSKSSVSRPSEQNGRTHIQASASGVAADVTVRTVTAGKKLHVTTLMVSGFNEDIAAGFGSIRIEDGSGGAAVMRFIAKPTDNVVGENPPINSTLTGIGISFLEPVVFSTSVFVKHLSGAVQYTVGIVGYEE